MPLDLDDSEELRRRRTDERVATNVEKALLYRYGWIVALVLGAYGLGAWAIVGRQLDVWIKEAVERNLDPARRLTDKIIADVTAASIQSQVKVANSEHDVRDLQADIANVKNQFSEGLAEAERTTAENLEGLKLETELQQKHVQADIDRVSKRLDSSRETIEKINDTLARLSNIDDFVADLEVQLADLCARKNRPSGLCDSIPGIRRGRQIYGPCRDQHARVAVYFSNMGRPLAEAIGKRIAGMGICITTTQRETFTTNQVRFYHPGDSAMANAVAKEVSREFQKLTNVTLQPEPSDRTNWDKKKPSPGTLEVWIAPKDWTEIPEG